MESTLCCSVRYEEDAKVHKKDAMFIRILNKIRILGAEEMSKTK